MSMFDDLEVTYRPIRSVSTCSTCGGDVPEYGRSITVRTGHPVVGIDPATLDLCHGHALMVCTHEVLPASAPIATRCDECGQLKPYEPPKASDYGIEGPIYLTENGAYTESAYRALEGRS